MHGIHVGMLQIVTSGTDRKLAYWDTFDGTMIRQVVASTSGAINGMDMSEEGGQIATGGGDKLVKVSCRLIKVIGLTFYTLSRENIFNRRKYFRFIGLLACRRCLSVTLSYAASITFYKEKELTKYMLSFRKKLSSLFEKQ